MRCSKCSRLMTFERFMGGVPQSIPWSYEGWRCITCGEIVDALILINRMKDKALTEKNSEDLQQAA